MSHQDCASKVHVQGELGQGALAGRSRRRPRRQTAQLLILLGSVIVMLFAILQAQPAVAATSGQLTLTWEDANPTDHDGFRIERKTGVAGTYVEIVEVGPAVLNYTDPNLPVGGIYCYQVLAYDAAGNFTPSNELCGTVPQQTFTLLVTKTGTGAGTVTSSPAGIGCGSTCNASFTSGSNVTLTATPSAGFAFTGWSGDCSGTAACIVGMTQVRAVTATFSVATVFTDDPLVPQTTPITAVHFTELRVAINTLRTQHGLTAFGWSQAAPAPGSAVLKAHLTDLRTALTQVYHAVNGTDPTYTDSSITSGATPIKPSHLSELRSIVQALN